MKVGFIKVAMPVRGAIVVPVLDGGKLTATGDPLEITMPSCLRLLP